MRRKIDLKARAALFPDLIMEKDPRKQQSKWRNNGSMVGALVPCIDSCGLPPTIDRNPKNKA
jgi:hypothetical protein